MAADLDYVPMPDAVVKQIQASAWSAVTDAGGKPVR
jgi:hypothetical protein